MEISIPTFNFIAIAPEIVVLVTALLVMVVDLFLAREQKHRLAWLSLVGVLAAGALSYAVWHRSDTQLQDMLVADNYALFLHMVILIAAALAILFSVDYADRTGLAQGEYYTLLLLSATGMMLMVSAVNLMTIFLGVEILSLALYILVGLNRAEQRSAEGALKYLLLGAFASGFLLYGMALFYGQAGTTSLSALRDYALSLGGEFPPLLLVGLGLMIIGFGFKVALVPFHMWTPDAYEGAPTSVTAFMSVGAKTAGFAALGRVALYALGDLHGDWVWLLAALSALTMTVGNLAALRQTSVKRMLAYSSIAHAGYISVGLAAGNQLGISALLFYLFAYTFMNVGAFAILIAAGRLEGSARQGETLGGLTGLYRRKPGLAVAMAFFMLSLAGVPPLAGFLAKLYVFGAAVEAGLVWLAVIGVINSVISAYYYLRVVAVMFLQERERAEDIPATVCPAVQVGLGVSAAAIVVLALWPAPILDLARQAAVAFFGG